jgi:type IV pilus assembly protein PilW
MTSKLRRRQHGLTLVELMVALIAALVLMAGAVQVFIANKTTFRTQEGLARVQESGRYAIERIGRSVRGAGFFGCAGRNAVTPNVLASDPPADLAAFSTGIPVAGLDDVGASNTFNAAAGTDVLTLRGAGDEGVGLTGNLTAINANIQIGSGYDRFYQGDLVLVTDCQTADLIRKTNQRGDEKADGKETIAHSNGSNIDNRLSKPYGADAYVLKPFAHSYFVKDAGRTNAAGKAIRSLYRRDLAGNDAEIVEGIADLQVLYGVDRDANNSADQYMSATQVNGANAWGDVVSVRVSLLADSVEGVLQQRASYQFMPISSTPITPAEDDDRRLHQEFTGLFTLRNRTL